MDRGLTSVRRLPTASRSASSLLERGVDTYLEDWSSKREKSAVVAAVDWREGRVPLALDTGDSRCTSSSNLAGSIAEAGRDDDRMLLRLDTGRRLGPPSYVDTHNFSIRLIQLFVFILHSP